jgi:hypothetical protein
VAHHDWIAFTRGVNRIPWLSSITPLCRRTAGRSTGRIRTVGGPAEAKRLVRRVLNRTLEVRSVDNLKADHDEQRKCDIPEMSTPTPQPAAEDRAVTEAAVERQDRALAVVQRLLKEQGIRSRRDHRISLGLFANRVDLVWPDRTVPRSWTRRYPPELVVIDPQGQCTATVTIEQRSGCHLLALHDGFDSEPVRTHEAGKVVALIAQVTPQASA